MISLDRRSITFRYFLLPCMWGLSFSSQRAQWKCLGNERDKIQYKSVITLLYKARNRLKHGYITHTIGYNAVWEGEESLIALIFSSPTVRAITDLYCIGNNEISEYVTPTVQRFHVWCRTKGWANKCARGNALLDPPSPGSDILFLKHGSRILRWSFNPECGSWKSQASSLWAKQHRA